MDQIAQRFLADRLENARAARPSNGIDRWSTETLASFGGAIEAFAAVGAISAEESQDWVRRMFAAIRREEGDALLVPRSGGAFAMSFGHAPSHVSRPPLPNFLALIPVANADRALQFGGRLQILGVERYDTRVAVSWRFAPLPNAEDAFARETALLERDTDGLPDEEREDRRKSFQQLLGTRSSGAFLLSDDVGTEYRPAGGNSGGGADERIGRTQFTPGIPSRASRLTIRWETVQFDVEVS